MRILITIPTWNEEHIIQHSLEILKTAVATFLSEHDVTIEIADNGSTDATRACVRDVGGVQLFELHERGKGLAIRRSWERHIHDQDVLVFMDADLAADLSALPYLIRPIIDTRAEFVCGSRFVAGAKRQRRLRREIASRIYRWLQRLFLQLPVLDAQCGFKAISTQAAQKLLPLCSETGWMFDTELIAQAKHQRIVIQEIPVQWIEHRDPNRRSTISIFRDGYGFLQGLWRISKRANPS